MKVELIAFTPSSDDVCAIAASTCVSKDIPVVAKHKGLEMAIQSGHLSTIEHCNLTYAVSGISRACLAQLSRHRLMSLSVQSQRYVNMDDFDFMIPDSIENTTDDIFNEYVSLMGAISKTYTSFIERGIPEEDARAVLPNACLTNLVLTINARELRHIAALRMCNRAQKEIRELVTNMVELAEEVAPIIFKGVGPTCVQTGKCPEKKPCGKIKEVKE